MSDNPGVYNQLPQGQPIFIQASIPVPIDVNEEQIKKMSFGVIIPASILIILYLFDIVNLTVEGYEDWLGIIFLLFQLVVQSITIGGIFRRNQSCFNLCYAFLWIIFGLQIFSLIYVTIFVLVEESYIEENQNYYIDSDDVSVFLLVLWIVSLVVIGLYITEITFYYKYNRLLRALVATQNQNLIQQNVPQQYTYAQATFQPQLTPINQIQFQTMNPTQYQTYNQNPYQVQNQYQINNSQNNQQ